MPHTPALDDLGSWWYALMQHYCAPTPLLDWTDHLRRCILRPAEEKARLERDPHCALWAVDADWLEEKKRELFAGRVKPRAVRSP